MPDNYPSGSIIKSPGPRGINKKLDLLDQKMKGLYRDIYVSRPDNKQNYDKLLDDLDTSIANMQMSDTSSQYGMSELMRRINTDNMSNSKKLLSSTQDLFSDNNLLATLASNNQMHRFISAQNYNYDLICRYMPKLLDALEIMRDNVLCSDNFSKNYINPKSLKSSKDEAVKFASNVKKLENEYDIQEFFDKTYMNTSKYGEDFIYVVPYNIAFQRLFKQDRNASTVGLNQFYAEGYIEESCLKPGFQESKEFKNYINSVEDVILKEDSSKFPQFGSVNLYFNTEHVVRRSVNETYVTTTLEAQESLKSLSEVYSEMMSNGEVISEARGDFINSFKSVGKQNRKLTQSGISNDGFIVDKSLDRDANKLDKNFLGAVLERLPRENIIPVYIGKKPLGYYYFEFEEDESVCGFCGGHHMTPGISNASRMAYDMSENQEELAFRFIAARISQSIDTHFINKNKDLKEEIYALLRYQTKFDITRGNNIGITFIPAEDIVHCYFELNEKTHRGVSDLERALIPAMLYILLYLTNVIAQITRSTDKRIYYVKQNVEQNVAATMMNVVAQIKKGNMGMRQIESMNNILNIVGKFNDYIIPMSQSGDPPIQFDVMQGQDIQTPTDLMDKMEEAAVNSTGCPLELVNSAMQQDFAIRFTMSSTRFLKKVYTRQRKTEKFFTKIYTKVYNYEFGENNSVILIVLPPPTYLTMNNTSQLLDNISQLADKIVEHDIGTASEEVKAEFKKLFIRDYLGTYINYDQVERLLQLATVNVETNKPPATEDGEASASDMMNDEL